jgi:hypothetical protein
VVEQALQRREHPVRAVGGRDDAIDEIGARQVQQRAIDRRARVVEQRPSLVAEQLLDPGEAQEPALGWTLIGTPCP